LHDRIVADLGGPDLQSELSLQTVRRVTGLIIMAEKAEIALARGDDIEVEKHIATINAFNRTAGALGLARRAKDITPTLADLLAQKVAERAQEAEEPDEAADGEG
jgi:hypothetical protein